MAETTEKKPPTLQERMRKLFEKNPDAVFDVDEIAKRLREDRKRVASNLPHAVQMGTAERAGVGKFKYRGGEPLPKAPKTPRPRSATNGSRPTKARRSRATTASASTNGHSEITLPAERLELITKFGTGELLLRSGDGRLFVAAVD